MAKGIAAIALAAVMATVAGLVVAGSGDPTPSADGRIAAYAETLGDKVSLPKDTVLFNGSLPAPIKDPPLTNLAGENAVRRHWVYRFDGQPDTFMSNLAAHGIAGFQMAVADGPIDGHPPSFILYQQAHPITGVYGTDLTVRATRYGQKQSLLRIDAALTPDPTRTAAERVSTADRMVTIDRVVTKVGGPNPPAEHKVVTDPAAVARLIDLFNSLPPTEPHISTYVYGACPGEEAIAVTFTHTVEGTPDLAASSAPKCIVDSTPFWVFGVAIDEPAQVAIPARGVPASNTAAARAERKREQPNLTDPDGAFVRALESELQK